MKMRLLAVVLATTGALMGVSTGANADLYLNGELQIGAQGFGNAHRLLTIQAQGNNTFESGAIGIVGGSMVALSPGIADASVFSGNGVTNLGGNEVSPLTDTLKFGIPTLGELNWLSGANVNLLFNAVEPGGNGLTVNDVTLKFYNGNNVIAAIDGNFSLASTTPGNGNAGFLISVDAAQQTYLNTNVFNQAGAASFRIALESTITGAAGGPESFSAIVSHAPEPGVYGMLLSGLGLMGFVAKRRKQKSA